MPVKRVARAVIKETKKRSVGSKIESNGVSDKGEISSTSTGTTTLDTEPPSPIVSWEQGQSRITKTGDREFKISFWNLNGIRAVLKPHSSFNDAPALQKYVEAEAPDILCMNETRIHDTQTHDYTNILPGYKGYFVSSQKKGYAGVATFVRHGVNATLEKKGLGHTTHDTEGRVQTFFVTPSNEVPPFYLVNTYVVNAGRGLVRLDYKVKNFNKDLYDYLNSLREKHPVVWTGDLNVAHQEIDIWNSKGNQKSAGHTPEERKSFGDFLLKSAWVDAFRHLYPRKIQYTYWSAMQPSNLVNNRGWRLDYFVLSKEFLPFCRDIYTRDLVRGSDHCPVVAVFASPQTEEGRSHSSTDNGTTSSPPSPEPVAVEPSGNEAVSSGQ